MDDDMNNQTHFTLPLFRGDSLSDSPQLSSGSLTSGSPPPSLLLASPPTIRLPSGPHSPMPVSATAKMKQTTFFTFGASLGRRAKLPRDGPRY